MNRRALLGSAVAALGLLAVLWQAGFPEFPSKAETQPAYESKEKRAMGNEGSPSRDEFALAQGDPAAPERVHASVAGGAATRDQSHGEAYDMQQEAEEFQVELDGPRDRAEALEPLHQENTLTRIAAQADAKDLALLSRIERALESGVPAPVLELIALRKKGASRAELTREIHRTIPELPLRLIALRWVSEVFGDRQALPTFGINGTGEPLLKRIRPLEREGSNP